jgi:hypothetical protein
MIRDRKKGGKRKPDYLEILVPNLLDDAAFETAATQWDKADTVWATLPRPMSPHQIETMVTFLLRKIPREFAFVLLSDLAEDRPMRADLLEQIFDTGNESCQVSVCLRSDLDERLEEKCRNSPNEQVREHHEARIRYRQMG